ncbi:MAG TPA: LPS export ABC transporter periplasmic protein LptC [Usitatibacteraceae bacterium]|nr:LPS export ABC transporter periplasmic protein LptC [Usitatibacteraceae bacterium]
MIRPSSWLPLAVLALLVGLTAWLNSLVQPPTPRASGKARHDPDLIVENFSARKLGEDGRVLYTLTARKMVHYPDDESARLERIAFEAREPRQPRVEIRSDAGRLLEGGDKVWFEGNVVMDRDADARTAASRLTTDKLLVMPDDGIARTTSPVVIESTDGRMEAEGLEINNQARTARLDRVRATYKAPRR